jgi:hypothetical protein
MKIHVMMDSTEVTNFDSNLPPAIGDRIIVTTKKNGEIEGHIVSREWDLRSEKILYVKAQSDKEAAKAAKAKKSKESSG